MGPVLRGISGLLQSVLPDYDKKTSGTGVHGPTKAAPDRKYLGRLAATGQNAPSWQRRRPRAEPGRERRLASAVPDRPFFSAGILRNNFLKRDAASISHQEITREPVGLVEGEIGRSLRGNGWENV